MTQAHPFFLTYDTERLSGEFEPPSPSSVPTAAASGPYPHNVLHPEHHDGHNFLWDEAESVELTLRREGKQPGEAYGHRSCETNTLSSVRPFDHVQSFLLSNSWPPANQDEATGINALVSPSQTLWKCITKCAAVPQ
ncbi:hypothetical protein EYF80_015128 [Liparis tanakae]|uniref:Uncharacterized protein n=1 Tax=Liparis tanakae TaxID=230148 RepID=A0A4Z2I9Z9_9TELE|nr:hypothetical protein EYF80_015128 [Liparis tanakae]